MRKTMQRTWFSGMNYRPFVEKSDFYFLSNAGYYRLTIGKLELRLAAFKTKRPILVDRPFN